MTRVDVMGCTWTQDFSFSSATIHAAFATATRDSQHEHENHERFDLTVLRIFGAHRFLIGDYRPEEGIRRIDTNAVFRHMSAVRIQ